MAKDYLIKNGYSNKQQYNQIANLAMLQTEINIQISNKAPNEYMKSVINQCIGFENKYGAINTIEDLKINLKNNCIPETFIEMDCTNYNDFLKKRRILMANKLKEYFKTL